MGKINQGILGGFSGKVGNVIGGNWKGIDYMRVKPANVANPKTEGQVDQRTKFSTVLEFLQPLKDFVKVGYKNYAIKMTEFNSAMSYVLKNGVTGSYPNFTIHYENALISRGSLAGVLNGTITSSTAGAIDFAWEDNSADSNASTTDKAMILALNSAKREAIFITEGVSRSTRAQSLTVPNDFSGDSVECFIAFISEDGLSVANSKYLGSVTVA
ncbi:hypothetical protein J1N10_04490 [Carboxylicivirga sp. A043]|uniref:DUF6266 family protein n=1 Tax=Carboxylicivirga litoralis TaxID=2816963 RepID=UPI0021CAF363|nr:DUF6266 family protein [Carboxylicivirga sp. A043]MCU4155220.1 hypothetical protein [Carboxylicivirga sp. A043]